MKGSNTTRDNKIVQTAIKLRNKQKGLSGDANNVFAHVDDMKEFAEGIYELLAEDGIFIFEVIVTAVFYSTGYPVLVMWAHSTHQDCAYFRCPFWCR